MSSSIGAYLRFGGVGTQGGDRTVMHVEDLDIRCERLAVRHTCFGVAVQDFV